MNIRWRNRRRRAVPFGLPAYVACAVVQYSTVLAAVSVSLSLPNRRPAAAAWRFQQGSGDIPIACSEADCWLLAPPPGETTAAVRLGRKVENTSLCPNSGWLLRTDWPAGCMGA